MPPRDPPPCDLPPCELPRRHLSLELRQLMSARIVASNAAAIEAAAHWPALKIVDARAEQAAAVAALRARMDAASAKAPFNVSAESEQATL